MLFETSNRYILFLYGCMLFVTRTSSGMNISQMLLGRYQTKISLFLLLPSLRTLYFSLIYSSLEYCVCRGSAPKPYTNILIKFDFNNSLAKHSYKVTRAPPLPPPPPPSVLVLSRLRAWIYFKAIH